MLKVRYKDIENKINNMKKSNSSNNELDKYDIINKIESWKLLDEVINLNSISEMVKNGKKCLNCEKKGFIKIKKFKSLEEQLNLDELNDNFCRCSCGKRHIDIVMAHILKIMKEENIEFKRFTLRNGPIPLLSIMFSNKNEPFIEKKSLIILHPQLTNETAKRIINEVSEVKGVIKGNSKDTVGLSNANNEVITYELLAGSDIRCDIIQSNAGEIAINKIQHLSYLEFPPSMETKIGKLGEYIQSKNLSQEEISNLRIIDGTCGNGTLGIFLLKLGVEKVIFSDIWEPAAIMTSINLKANGFGKNEEKIPCEDNYNISKGDNFEVYNLSLEELVYLFSNNENNENDMNGENNANKSSSNANKSDLIDFDLCILDCFPGTNTNRLEKSAKTISKDVLII